MLRLRWFDAKFGDPALITATLFLNFPFWYLHGDDLRMFCPLPLYAGVLMAGALLITALFFVGPALAAQRARLPILAVIESSVGTIPAYGLRLCCVWFLVYWIENLLALPSSWLSSYILRRENSSTESGPILATVLVFLFFHGPSKRGHKRKARRVYQ